MLYTSSTKHVSSRRGFSLIEFTAVLALMAVLAGIVTINVRHFMTKGKQNAARVEIATLRDALEAFNTAEGRYPANEEGLAALVQPGSDGGGGLIRKMPRDPWGRMYQYNTPGDSEPYEIVCLGADGREGGAGADADIASYDLKEKNAR